MAKHKARLANSNITSPSALISMWLKDKRRFRSHQGGPSWTQESHSCCFKVPPRSVRASAWLCLCAHGHLRGCTQPESASACATAAHV